MFAPGAAIAVDTETMGLITMRDRLCVVQLSDGTGDEHLVRFNPGSSYAAPNLRAAGFPFAYRFSLRIIEGTANGWLTAALGRAFQTQSTRTRGMTRCVMHG